MIEIQQQDNIVYKKDGIQVEGRQMSMSGGTSTVSLLNMNRPQSNYQIKNSRKLSPSSKPPICPIKQIQTPSSHTGRRVAYSKTKKVNNDNSLNDSYIKQHKVVIPLNLSIEGEVQAWEGSQDMIV